MLTKEQEILLKIETSEGTPDYASGKSELEKTDGMIALDLDFQPEAEFEDSDVASGTLDTAAATVGVESASIGFGDYLRGTAGSLTAIPKFDAAIRACGMVREQLYTYVLDVDELGDLQGSFVHGEDFAICVGSGVSVSQATDAIQTVITTAAHGIPVGAKVPIVLVNVPFAGVHTLDNKLDGGWLEAEALTSTTLRLTNVDTSMASGNATGLSGTCYLPPIIHDADIATTAGDDDIVMTVGTKTTIRLNDPTVYLWTGGVGDTIDLWIDGVSGSASLPDGRYTATVSAVDNPGNAWVELQIDVDTTGDTLTGDVTIIGMPIAKVAGEYGALSTDDKLVVYDERGRAPAAAVLGGFGSKATAQVKSGSSRAAGGWRYRPIGERTFQLTVASWAPSSSPPVVGQILTRLNKCGAYGRVVAVSSNGLTITYEPYGDSFAVGNGVRKVQGDGNGDYGSVTSVTSVGGPSVTIEPRLGGVVYTYAGARGTFSVQFEVGKAMRINFEFLGLKYKNPVDSVLAGVVKDESGKLRFLQGFSKTRDLSGLKVCDFKYEIQTAEIALNRTPTQKPDATTATGVRSYRHQEEYVPEITMDPAMTPVGVHPFYEIASNGGTVAQLFGAGTVEGNRCLMWLPAVQYGVGGFGDRSGERTKDFTGFCRKSEGNDAAQLFIY